MSIEWTGQFDSKAGYRTARFDLARQATQRHPSSAAAWHALAECHFHNQDFAEVVAAADRGVELGSPTGHQLCTYAKALIALGRPRDAIEAVERHAREPADPGLHAVRGEIFRQLERFADARAEFDKALAADPGEVTAGRGLALMLAKQGAWQALLEVIAGIEANSPSSMALRVAKAQALSRLGRHAEARTLLDFDRVGRVQTIPVPDGFDSLANFNAALVAELASPQYNRLSDRPRLRLVGGTQIEDLAASEGPALQSLFGAIRTAVEHYFVDAPVTSGPWTGRSAPRRATLAPWALVLGPDDFQARHYHVEAAVAGVYYVAAPAGVLKDGEVGGALVIPDLPADLEGADNLVRHIQPRPGRLVLFPGYLPHHTLPTRRPGQRISIAFNVVSDDGPA